MHPLPHLGSNLATGPRPCASWRTLRRGPEQTRDQASSLVHAHSLIARKTLLENGQSWVSKTRGLHFGSFPTPHLACSFLWLGRSAILRPLRRFRRLIACRNRSLCE